MMKLISASTYSVSRRQFIGAGVLAVASYAPVSMANTDQYPVATTRSGKIRGQIEHNIAVFRGVPYGADTTSRRFMPAEKELPWDSVRDAFEFGPAAPQGKINESISEDCLSLNVWTPGLRDGARRPILFYIHGGGYHNGSGADPQYDGINLCLRGDVVVVTVNHRLNAFGYLYLAQLGGKEFAHSGNVGQLDLVQALRWVKEHAQEFGGDKDNVTVFGQSGGGAKIITLMAMPVARNLFHRAFTMSGQQVTAAGPRAATQRAEIFLDALVLPRAKIAAIKTLPIEKLLEATQEQDPSRVENNRLYFGPVLDNQVLLRHPFYPDAPAQSREIPLVIGNTKDETRAFLGGDPANFSLTWEQLPKKLIEQQYVDLNADIVIAEYRRLYPDYSPSDIFFAATTAGRSWRGAIIQAEERAKQGAPAFVYQLDWGSPLDGGKFGAFHTLDIPLVFDNIVQPGSRTGHSAAAQKVADQMSNALLAFARTGNPSHRGIPTWKPYTLDKRETLIFNEKSALAFDPRGGERKLYARVPFIQRGTF
jgi:para-nitrobenzyl esterase